MDHQPRHHGEEEQHQAEENPYREALKNPKALILKPTKLNSSVASLTVVVEGFLVRVTFGDHHGHDDELETRQHKHAAVLHVGQIFLSNDC